MELKSLFDITKLPTKILVVLAAISGILLFSGKPFLAKLHMSNVHEKYGSLIGFIFLISVGIVGANIVVWFVRLISKQWFKSKFRKTKLEYLAQLNTHEKALLREFFLLDKRTLDMPMDDATVSGLLSKGMIHIVQQFSGGILVKFGSVAPIMIDDFIHRNIRYEHLDMVENPTEQHITFYRNNRPIWVDHVDQINRLMNGRF